MLPPFYFVAFESEIAEWASISGRLPSAQDVHITNSDTAVSVPLEGMSFVDCTDTDHQAHNDQAKHTNTQHITP